MTTLMSEYFTYDKLLLGAKHMIALTPILDLEDKKKVLWLLDNVGLQAAPEVVVDMLERAEVPLAWYLALLEREEATALYRKEAYFASQYNNLKPGSLMTEGGVYHQIVVLPEYERLNREYINVKTVKTFMDKVYWSVIARRKRLAGIRDYQQSRENI